MKKIKVVLLAAIIVAVGSAFATAPNFAPCDEQGVTIYGKINLAGDDSNPANFRDVSTVTSWTCVSEISAHCLYYFDEASQTFLPCNPQEDENRKFQILVP